MPDFVKHSNGDIDWSKFFMGMAIAFTFAMQQYHNMKLNDLSTQVVPRTEYNQKADKVLDRDIIIDEFKQMNKRLDRLENIKKRPASLEV